MALVLAFTGVLFSVLNSLFQVFEVCILEVFFSLLTWPDVGELNWHKLNLSL